MTTSFSSQRAVPASSTEDIMQKQLGEWDAEMDGIDKKQEQLLNEQWRLLRSQIGTLMGALSEMRTELNAVKDQVGQDIAGEIAKMIDAQDAHGSNHASIAERVQYLEEFVGESADKHNQLSNLQGAHDEHRTSMEARLEYMEGLIGDSADKHADEIGSAMKSMNDLHAAISACAKAEHHESMEQRVEYLEKLLGESAGKHDDHKTSMETRLEYIEGLLGDSSDKHSADIDAANKTMKDLHAAISQCSKAEHHSSLEKRMEYLEQFLGESADNHEEHKTTLETRLEYIEALIGDSADKHSKELEEAKSRLGDLHQALKSCARTEHHSGMEKRLDYLEKFLGESLDKHKEDLKDTANSHIEHKESMETRLEYIESLIGDSADKHAKEIDALRKKHMSMETAVSKCAQATHHSGLEDRVDFLEKLNGESFDKHSAAFDGHKGEFASHKRSMEGKIEAIERVLKEHANDIDSKGHKNEIEQLQQILVAGIEQRLSVMEDKHLKDFVQRMSSIEQKHALESGDLKNRVADLDKALQECARIDHYLGLDAKHGGLQESLGKELETVRSKMSELQNKVSSVLSQSDKNVGLMEGRIEGFERKIVDVNDVMNRKVCTVEAGQTRLKTVVDELGVAMRGDKSAREMTAGTAEERLARLEQTVKGTLDTCLKDVEATQGKMREISGRLGSQQAALDSYRSSLDLRVSQLETGFSAGSQGADLIKDFEMRIQQVQEDQQRQRHILETSIYEKIGLEHSAAHSQASQIKETWDRELKARQAYQENFKELLSQERNSREATQDQLDRRVEMFERNICSEMQRMWHDLGAREPQVIQAPPPQTTYVMSPRTVSYPKPVQTNVRVSPPATTRVIAPGETYVAGAPYGTVTSTVATPAYPMANYGGVTEIDKVNAFGQVVERDFYAGSQPRELSMLPSGTMSPLASSLSIPLSGTSAPVVTRQLSNGTMAYIAP
jgi:hypothetical protein